MLRKSGKTHTWPKRRTRKRKFKKTYNKEPVIKDLPTKETQNQSASWWFLRFDKKLIPILLEFFLKREQKKTSRTHSEGRVTLSQKSNKDTATKKKTGSQCPSRGHMQKPSAKCQQTVSIRILKGLHSATRHSSSQAGRMVPHLTISVAHAWTEWRK
jgi:hypothetical protein